MALHRSRTTLLICLAALLLAPASAGAQETTDPGGSTLPPGCAPLTEFEPEDFSRPTKIDNRFLPMRPWTRTTLEGQANRGPGALPHRVSFTVTDLTKVINGVRTRVVWDVDENQGQLRETELAFFAQDDEGNVWNLGEYPEEWQDGFFLTAENTWIAGLAGAQAGVHMPASPRLGMSYLQGFVPDIEFLDCAEVVAERQKLCVPFDCYDRVLVTHERSPLDPAGGIQTKAHAPRVGIVEVGAIDDPEGETLVLVERRRLRRDERQAARDAALQLDARGYLATEVYSQTEPAKPPAP